MQVSRSRLEFDQVPLLQHQNIFLADFYNVYCHNPYIVKKYFFLPHCLFSETVWEQPETHHSMWALSGIMISQDTLFVICKLVDKKWQKVKNNKVILSMPSSIFPAPEFYLRERITAVSPWQFLSRSLDKSLLKDLVFSILWFWVKWSSL